MQEGGSAERFPRTIRSFVKRTGRMTEGQKYALQHYWPQYGIEFDPDQSLNFQHLFPTAQQVWLEIGFGNGDSLVEIASQHPDAGFIGIEVHTPGVGHCLNHIHQLGLTNLRLMSHDAVEILQHMIPSHSLDRVLLFFPDPWHKKKHHKRRIVNVMFRDLVFNALKTEGILHMATDWQDYAEHMAEQMLPDPRFLNLGAGQGYSDKPDYRPQTKFERRGLKLGHGVWDLLFQKTL